MKLLVGMILTLATCFAQDQVNQISEGACSANISNVSGDVTITFSGSACSSLPKELKELVVY